MQARINAFKKKEMPSKFGGTWTITNVKFDGIDNPEYGYELVGFDKKTIENLQQGQTLTGFMSHKSWTNKEGITQQTKTFNAVDANYVYNLLLKIAPQVETTPGVAPTATAPAQEAPTDEEIPHVPGW